MMNSLFNSILKTYKLSTFKQETMRKLIIISILLSSTFIFAQETKKDTLKTEEIVVVKPYTPTISDAFKITTNPKIDNSNIAKENVNYSIFSIPVASTFTPSKGKAQKVTRPPKERLFENYISAGFGNFTSPLFEAYIHSGDSRYNDFGIFINHHSSEGGVDDAILNDNFADTQVDLYYKQFDRDYTWQINAGVKRNELNYYGLPQNDYTFSESFLNSIDEKQVYKTIYAGGKISLNDSFFQGVSVEVINFSDEYSSNEFRILAKPKVEFPISTELINAEILVDLVSGKFDQTYLASTELKHSYLNLGFNPNFEVRRENLSINLGAKLYYTNDLENKVNEFKAYPNVTGSFKVVDDIFIVTAGITGDLIQNTYQNFSTLNPYISPSLNIKQTDKQYKAFAGAKGKLASNVSYNFMVSHTYEKNKPLFAQNQILTDGNTAVSQAFQAGNSFNVVYDDIKTLDVSAEINIDASKEFNFGGTINYYNFNTEMLLEAWNLPEIEANITANYQNNSWYAGAKLFYRGETKDYIIPHPLMSSLPEIISNDSYIDLNLNGGYIFSDRLTAFAKINNALGKKYHRFVNYEVQALQILAGITYKFDL